ncbi:MAG: hypothetical protein JSR58_04865 [Verrucomicrobia bacterium]|nr:hypothetical protein [Verrucomicrobiota bacterium]
MSFVAKIQPKLHLPQIDIRVGHDNCQENDLEELVKAVREGILPRQVFNHKTLLLEVNFPNRMITDKNFSRKQEDYKDEFRLYLMCAGLECESIKILSSTFQMKTPMDKSILMGLDLEIKFL